MKKKAKNQELDWADDKEAKEKVENLASRAAEALSGLLSEESAAQSATGNSEQDEVGDADELLNALENESVESDGIESAESDSETDEDEEFFEEELLNLAQSQDEEPADKIVYDDDEGEQQSLSVSGTELEGYDSASIEEIEQLSDDRIASIVESLLFATDRPQSVAMLKAAFKGTNVRSHHLRRALDQLQIEYAGARRGIYLEEVAGGYQLRTKVDNMEYMRRTMKARPFKVSGPALEVLAIVAYKQPITKSQIDEIRGVESGHLLRALMEKNLVHFAGKSELPGKPMLYGTSRRFLEIFSLRNLNELPSLSEIDQLIPEGIGDVEEKETLSDLTGALSKDAGATYSEGEEELLKIATDLEQVTTTTEFFEQEKARMRAERDKERAQDIREAILVGEEVAEADRRWLDRYEREQAAALGVSEVATETAGQPNQNVETGEQLLRSAEQQLEDAKIPDEIPPGIEPAP